MAAVGIDLGTTFSVVAFVGSQGLPRLVPDIQQADQFRTPSVIAFDDGIALVGQLAEDLLFDDPSQEIIRHIKLDLGIEHAGRRDDMGRLWRPESLSAVILKKLAKDLAAAKHETIESLVICVPANFTSRQRNATKLAATLSGLPIPHLVDEPVAAATYLARDAAGTVLVFDLGGGTFDVSLIETEESAFHVLATRGANDLGGGQLDAQLTQLLLKRFFEEHQISLDGDIAAHQLLTNFARDAKEQLSSGQQGSYSRRLVIAQRLFNAILTREDVEEYALPMLNRAFETTERCLEDAGLNWGLLDRILLVGGSTLFPFIKREILRRSGLSADRVVTHQPHFAVAYGAAIIAGMRATAGDDSFSMQHVLSHDIGLRTHDRATGKLGFEILLPRNEPLPAAVKRMFYTHSASQTSARIELLQRKSEETVPDLIGAFTFSPIANPRANLPIEITVECDIEGLLHVSARNTETNDIIRRSLLNSEDDAMSTDTSWYLEQKRLIDLIPINL